jgi:hypothetical protein
MRATVETIEVNTGVTFFDYQAVAINHARCLPGPNQRLCLYYKTGAGKTITALALLYVWGYEEAVVITPPITFPQWERQAAIFGIKLHLLSHAKFRMPGTKLSRKVAVIADEMHLFGGHTGKGWMKLDRLAMHLQAPMILASATPNYNDAERVYCIEHILDPIGTKGGFIAFVYKNCETEANPFGEMPNVTGFLNYPDAAAYLADLPGVEYLPDDLVFTVQDLPIPEAVVPELDQYGYYEREHKIIGSIIEERHARVFLTLVNRNGEVYDHVYDKVKELIDKADTPVLIYCNHSTVADALSETLLRHGMEHGLITGRTTPKNKAEIFRRFLFGQVPVLVGTASLATGSDGMDQVCDWLIILDDTEDEALRRQLIGRIMPRGENADASKKNVYRVIWQ